MKRRSLFKIPLVVLTLMALVSWRLSVEADDPNGSGPAAGHPLSDEDRAKLQAQWASGIAELTRQLETQPDSLAAYSKRGDLHFFRGDFAKSVRDYERMVELDPKLDAAHWRLGIAYFYAGQPEQAARQFDKFFMTDDVDREAGLWKYIAQAATLGADKARAGLLKYHKDDREPLPSIYRLFAEELTPEQLLKTVDAQLPEKVREQRMFYIELYLGLWHDAHQRPAVALPHFRAATANRWGRTASYGPNYMWHVARLHYEKLAEKLAAEPARRQP
jgi:lipoprotein NlpI